MPQTLVAINAHPDDEALLCGGTLAKAARGGHRVVLITLTDGDAGISSAGSAAGGLGSQRLVELEKSAEVLGAARVEFAGYSDSGMDPTTRLAPTDRTRLVDASLADIVDRVCEIIADESPNLMLGYDEAGGYGHRDHVVVHHVAREVARRTQSRLLEVTAPREPLYRALSVLGKVRGFANGFDPAEWADKFTPKSAITHRVCVSDTLTAKRAALAAHASQAISPDDAPDRTITTLLKLPLPLFGLLLGREFFTEAGAAPVRRPLGDIWVMAR